MSRLELVPNDNAPAALDPQNLEQRLAPVDEFGMPYLLHPYDPPSRYYETRRDDDHSFYQQNNDSLKGQAGQALLISRVQTVPRWLHNNKHYAFYDGIEQFPQNDSEKFALTVLACAGYVSRTALDVRNRHNPKLVTMSRNTYDFVRGKRQLHFETKKDSVLGYRTQSRATKKIGQFFGDYIRTHGLEGVIDEKIVDEFISTSNEIKRKKLGNKILGHAMNAAVEPVAPIYKDAMKEGALRPTKKHPVHVVLDVFPVSTWPDYHQAIEEALAA